MNDSAAARMIDTADVNRLGPTILLLGALLGCSSGAPANRSSPAPPAATPPTAALPVTQPSTSPEYFLASEMTAYVPRGFDTLRIAKNVCAQMQAGREAREVHAALQQLEFNRNGATKFQSTAMILYCQDQLPKLPDGPNDWWG